MYRFKRYTEKANAALNLALECAREMGHTYVGTEHLLLGLLREGSGVAAVVLGARGITVMRYAEVLLASECGGAYSHLTAEDFTPRARAVMEAALTDAAMAGLRLAGTEHLLGAILRDDTSVAVRLLTRLDGRPGELLGDLQRVSGTAASASGNTRPAPKAGRTPVLDQYGRDLTRMAREGRMDPVIGRETEIRRVIQILCRRTKNNPCLIGEPGVGKTAVVEGLAQYIAAGDVPECLRDKRLLTLDLTGMVAGTKYRGDFEERVKNAIAEVGKAGDVLLFIDELHNLIGAGAAEGAVDAANILKPVLARGELQLIGATTIAEYRKHIEKDAALERRFQPVTVGEPTPDQTRAILQGLRERYEAHHRVRIGDAALCAAVDMAVRYIPDRFLPDKAIDLMDEAASRVRLRSRVVAGRESETALTVQSRGVHSDDEVLAEDVAAVVAGWTGIPAEQLSHEESRRLQQLEEILHRRLVGQEEAVSAVARAVRRSRVGLQDPDRPGGSFLFCGPTGVGKTELCRALAEALFGDEKAVIRLDMSEYMEQHAVSRLVGSPPGYVGHEEGGQLTEAVRRHPYSVVLLDEIEKAHPDLFNLLLQGLEDGQLTDSQGRRVDFRHTLIIMTSNVGARRLAGEGRVGFADRVAPESAATLRAEAMGELKKLFRPEFLNRVDEVVVFRPLDTAQVTRIAKKMLDGLCARVERLGYACHVDEQVADLLAQEGFDPVYGARPLRRAVQSRVEDPLAERLLTGHYHKGDTVRVEAKEGQIVFQ
ncbi:MAG: ATP-dependent Clp protease ATP-binding subunit [Clostridia bacterium]|nr:ATP-dependent Clp protease ATP-binding subunit [Clostridia bacterium]